MQRRSEISNEQQRDMEQAFEDLFVRCQGITIVTNCNVPYKIKIPLLFNFQIHIECLLTLIIILGT